MVHKKTENQVKYMLADTILALCGSTISYEAEVRVEGLLGITIDDQEVFLVQINKSMRKGTPRSPRKSERTTKTDKGGKSEKKAAGEKSAKKAADKADKPAEKSTERPKKDGGQADSSLTRQSRRKRKATWKVKLNMGEDHDYISSPEKDAKKRKQKTAAELGLVALDSSDSEDDNAGGDVAEESRDGDEENVLVEQEVVYVNDGGRSSKSGPAPSDSSDDDDYDVGQSMPDLEPLDSSEGDGALAAMDSGGEEFGTKRRGRRRVRNKKTCEECHKMFHDSSALKIHMRIHSGEKPFSCTFCQRAFRQRSQMRAHVKSIHTHPKRRKKKKTFANLQRCDRCPKVFINKEKLDMHVKIVHLNEKPFECEVCDKAFCTKNSLKMHMLKGKHDPRRKKQKCTCPVCFQVFPEAARLESHIAESHIEIPLVRLVESDGREILGVNVKNIPGLEKTLKAADADIKQEVMSEAGEIHAEHIDGEITMETEADISRMTDSVALRPMEEGDVSAQVSTATSILATDTIVDTTITEPSNLIPENVIVVTSAAIV